jgi:hypothetical protein
MALLSGVGLLFFCDDDCPFVTVIGTVTKGENPSNPPILLFLMRKIRYFGHFIARVSKMHRLSLCNKNRAK